MPKLPTAADLGIREAAPPTAIAHYQPTSGAEEAPGLALAGAGDLFQTHVANEMDKRDTAQVENAWNQYKTKAIDLTSGPAGALRKQSGDAVNGNLVQTATDELAAHRKSILDTLENDDQRRRFAQRADATDLGVKSDILHHVAAQTNVYAEQTLNGTVGTTSTAIAQQPMNEKVWKNGVDTVAAQADNFLRQRGVTGDAAQVYKDKLSDGLWNTRLDALLYANPQYAGQLFRANADAIHNPELKRTLQAKVNEVEINVNATTSADQIIAQTRQAPPNVGLRPAYDLTKRDADLQQVNATLAKTQPGQEGYQDLLDARYALENAGVAPGNTTGMPNSRDIAAQLPLALAKVSETGERLYGKDPNNPDRIAFEAKLRANIQSKMQSEVQQLNAIQEQSAGVLLDAIAGIGGAAAAGGTTAVSTGAAAGTGGGAKITSYAQIQANPTLMRAYQTLNYQQKAVVDRTLEKNLKNDEKGDPALYNELRNRIELPPTDPNKINWWQTLSNDPRVQAGNLNIAQLNSLRSVLKDSSTDDGRSQAAKQQLGGHLANGFFQGDWTLTAAGTQKGNADLAMTLWQMNADKVVGLYKQQNKPVDDLFDPTKPGSLVSPQALKAISLQAGGMASGAQALSAGAAGVKDGTSAPVIAHPKSEADYNALPPGTMFIDPKGKTRQKPAAAPSTAAGGAPAAAPTPTAPGAPAPLPGQITLGADGTLTKAAAPAGETMADTGQLQPASAGSPAPPEDNMRLIDAPATRSKGMRSDEQKEITQLRVRDAVREGLERGASGLFYAATAPLRLALTAHGEIVEQVKKLLPTEEDRAVGGFRNLVKQAGFRANEDTYVMLNNALLSDKLSKAEKAVAQRMVVRIADKLGIEPTPAAPEAPTAPDVSDIAVTRTMAGDRSRWAPRADGSQKGYGFLGALRVPGTKDEIASEYSIGTRIGGKDMEIPTLVPTLTRAEVDRTLQAIADHKMPPEPVIKKAIEFAKERVKAGKPVFATDQESPQGGSGSGGGPGGDATDIIQEDNAVGVGRGRLNLKKALGAPGNAGSGDAGRGYKAGSDDARVTGKETTAQEEVFAALLRKRGLSEQQIRAEIQARRR